MNSNTEIIEQNRNGGKKDQGSTDLSLLDTTSASDNKIDQAAQEFVDSDETLNEELNKAASTHIVINKGYPYND